ncbi:KpsF/GutQ family sugar-phosphate isomerase [Nocardioides astragali]|uniref:SIS domain-containing protein n=1 Tax=Nocardioides astragali TaxID=1776736 RepID=A0ABW2N2Z0_9ACTN|nr:KpsF/GutQ family sugar-phosphate isomerase [Nocardioides astragali]
MVDPAARVLRIEAEALTAAADRLDEATYADAVKSMADTDGPILTTGVGTSGVVARKLAATLTSTGSRAVFLHPSDALHGQLGLLRERDVVVAISNSGETEEILAALPYLRSRNAQIIAIVGTADSTLGRSAAVVLDAFAEVEACPLNLAPTSSTTLALAVGDALAVSLMAYKDITAENFALNHPSGRLGRRLTLSVADLMQPVAAIGSVATSTSLLEVLACITSGGVGAAVVVDGDRLAGLITDGDVRRCLGRLDDTSISSVTAADVMTRDPEVVGAETAAYDALLTMEQRESQISVLPVVDGSRVVGIVRLHDLIRSGL